MRGPKAVPPPTRVGEPAVPARAQEPGIVAFEAVLQALVEGDDATRSAAARELAFQGRPEAVPHLLAALARPEPSPWVRKDIYGALGSLGEAAALPALLACLDGESREELLAACVAALGQIGDPAALPSLLPLAAGAGAAPVRLRAIEALGGLDDPAATAALIALLEDPEPAARSHAARALARHPGADALAALIRPTTDYTLIKDVDLGDSGALIGQVNYQYRDRIAYTDSNFGWIQDAHQMDANISWETPYDGFTVSVFGKNLFDEVQAGNDTQLPFPGRHQRHSIRSLLGQPALRRQSRGSRLAMGGLSWRKSGLR